MSIMFACIMVLMLFVGIWGITVSVSQARTALQTQSFFSYLFSNRTFRDLLISTSATYGLYLASSIIHLDPWHVINSFVQYLLLLPTYTNVFMIYSFCNLHDVSWGTKGDNNSKAEANSVNIVTKANGEKVLSSDVEIPEDSLEASIIWKEFAKKLKEKPPTAVSKPIDQAVMNEDSSKEYRTKVVLFWMFCNAALVIVFTNNTFLDMLFPRTQMGATGPNYVNPYLTFLFWSVAFLSFFRFVGSALYMSQWWKEKALDKAQALSRKHGGEV
jgi:chitin synthase